MKAHGDVFSLEPGSFLALDDAPGLLIKGSQGLIYGWHCSGQTADPAYVQVFDSATLGAVTLGSTVPKFVIAVPGEAEGKFSSLILPFPITMALGICVFSTTTPDGSTAKATDGQIFHA